MITCETLQTHVHYLLVIKYGSKIKFYILLTTKKSNTRNTHTHKNNNKQKKHQ